MIFASLLHNESNTKFLQMCHYLITYTGKKVQRQGTLVSRAFPWLPTQSSLNAVPPLTSVYICTWLALTNSWSLLPTTFCLYPCNCFFLPLQVRPMHASSHNILDPPGLGPLLHWPVLAASPGAFQMARILASTPVTTDNSQTHKGKSALKRPDFQLPVDLLHYSVNCLRFPFHCSEKHSFPKRSPIFPSDFHRVK